MATSLRQQALKKSSNINMFRAACVNPVYHAHHARHDRRRMSWGAARAKTSGYTVLKSALIVLISGVPVKAK